MTLWILPTPKSNLLRASLRGEGDGGWAFSKIRALGTQRKRWKLGGSERRCGVEKNNELDFESRSCFAEENLLVPT